jgi:hypothetical protein
MLRSFNFAKKNIHGQLSQTLHSNNVQTFLTWAGCQPVHAEPVDLLQSNCISFAEIEDDGLEQQLKKGKISNASSSGIYHPIHFNLSYFKQTLAENAWCQDKGSQAQVDYKKLHMVQFKYLLCW